MTKAKAKTFKVPFDPNGNLLHWAWNGGWTAGRWEYGLNGTGTWVKGKRLDKHIDTDQVKWREPANFKVRLTPVRMLSGRSAKYLIWKDDEGHTYPMFMTDLIDALPYIDGGALNVELAFCKRGANFGVRVFGTQAQDLK